MRQEENIDDSYEVMEKQLLPAFKEAVAFAKEASGNPNFFKEAPAAHYRLYALALMSTVVRAVNRDIKSEEHKLKNIDKIQTGLASGPDFFYQPDGSLRKIEDVYSLPEVQNFRDKMNSYVNCYVDHANISVCWGMIRNDMGVDPYENKQPIISSDGNSIDWKNVHKSAVFMHTLTGTTDMLLRTREQEKQTELKIRQYSNNKQKQQLNLDIAKER